MGRHHSPGAAKHIWGKVPAFIIGDSERAGGAERMRQRETVWDKEKEKYGESNSL